MNKINTQIITLTVTMQKHGWIGVCSQIELKLIIDNKLFIKPLVETLNNAKCKFLNKLVIGSQKIEISINVSMEITQR